MADHLLTVPPLRSHSRRHLGQLLVSDELITPAQLTEALACESVLRGRRERLGETVVRLGFASDVDVARALAFQLDLDFIGSTLVVDEQIAALIPKGLAERHRVLPLWQEDDGTLVVACADPTNVVAVDDLRAAAAARRIRLAVAPAAALDTALRKAYGFDGRAAGELIERIDADSPLGEDDATDDPEEGLSDAPVIRLAQGIIGDAVSARASDIHIEPMAGETRVRHRIDGVLRQVMLVPRSASGPLLSRIKLMAGMDIAERRRPQDGRTHFRTGGHDVDLRVSSLPSMHGETLVIRILRKGAERATMDDVGFSRPQLATVLSNVERPQGLVLLTGPTGAGKTSTLYAFVSHLANESNKIVTIEDPVEYQLPGISQTQVNERIQFTFPRALRTVLRQDPDIVMVGEIRDPETAELALQASLTGHLVFSTLHTNDAPGAIVRLRDLGVPPYLIASSLTMVIAQRLVRTICRACSMPAAPTDRERATLHLQWSKNEGSGFRTGAGCQACNDTGYFGRTGLFELLPVDSAVRELIATNASEAALRHAARLAGMRSLREDGLEKAAAGVTTLEEVMRVSPTDFTEANSCPVCAETVAEDFAVCPWCSADLGHDDACAQCGRNLERGWRVCPTCSHDVPAAL